ncbi:hypothetical protein J5X84_11405 [Streptosporangiaceae bacterium NEAU-GS5]|nr:hypothetical protein [Streptosporangiaceae bacterium NEAU-GS5]
MGQVVRYTVDESTIVSFEIDAVPGYQPAAAPDDIAGRIQEAVEPATKAAQAVLDQVKQAGPDEIELKFGIKVSGTMNWLVAKAATEGNFEVTMTWKPNHA